MLGDFRRLAPALCCCVLGCSSSSGTCTLDLRYGLSVRVLDSKVNQPICDATVLANGAPLGNSGTFPSCSYEGLPETGGEYDVQVSRDGYDTKATHASIQKGECHVVPVSLAVSLDPR